MSATAAERTNLGVPERRAEELELPDCIYCRDWVDPQKACVFWPSARVNAVAHVRCHVAAELIRTSEGRS
jgi:hypothetical protein